MQQVAEGIYQLGSTHHNFYLLTAGGKATVIDAGCSKELSKLEAGLAQLGMTRDDVEAIVLTHAHADHMGFAAEAEKLGTEIRASEPEAPIATGEIEGHAIKPMQMPLWRLGTWRFIIALAREGILSAPNVESVVTFSDGEVLDLPGRPRAVYTPGHTIGHAAFYLPEAKTVFSGDAIATRDLFSESTGPQLMPDKFHTDPALARASLDVLAGIDAELLLPGHGHPLRGPIKDAVAAARG